MKAGVELVAFVENPDNDFSHKNIRRLFAVCFQKEDLFFPKRKVSVPFDTTVLYCYSNDRSLPGLVNQTFTHLEAYIDSNYLN